MKMLKKGQMGNLQGFLLGIVGVAIVLTVGLIVLTELQGAADNTATYCATGYTYNSSAAVASQCMNTSVAGGAVAITRTSAYTSTGTIITKLATVPTWVGIIIVVALAFIVLGFFYMKGQ
jgi:hypothetical protein